jgi:hypothetical protein
MACDYLWTLRRYLTAQYLLVSRWSGGVFSFFSVRFRVIYMIVNWAFFNAQGVGFSLLFDPLVITHFSIKK